MVEKSTVRITETEDGPPVIDGHIKLIDARRVELEAGLPYLVQGLHLGVEREMLFSLFLPPGGVHRVLHDYLR